MRPRQAQLREEFARLVDQAEARDARKDRAYGVDSDRYSIADELALHEARLADGVLGHDSRPGAIPLDGREAVERPSGQANYDRRPHCV